ncbi:hypothetical protein ACXN5S_19265 [Pseudoroseicyclus sp. H15]
MCDNCNEALRRIDDLERALVGYIERYGLLDEARTAMLAPAVLPPRDMIGRCSPRFKPTATVVSLLAEKKARLR